MEIPADRPGKTLKLMQPVIPKNVLLKDGKVAASNLDARALYDLPEVGGECLLPHKQIPNS